MNIETREITWQVAAGGAARAAMQRTSTLVAVREGAHVGLGEAAPLSEGGRERAMQFAHETARLDLEARIAGVPLHARFRGHVDALPVAAVVDTVDEARAAFASGCTTLKLKVAPGGIERVHEVHRALPDARLRLDANAAWSPDEAMGHLRALAKLPIDFVEEPCPDAHVRAWPVPIALDESLATMTDDQLQCAMRAVEVLVLKPTLLGGFARCLVIAARARAAGKRVVVTHALEGPVGTAACAELALALGGDVPAGLAAHPALAAWSLAVPQIDSASIHTALRPGLGLDLDSLDELTACVRGR